MITGPPTPPPTTVTELLDEQKDRVPTSTSGPVHASEEPSPSPQQDLYQLAFPTIAKLAAKGDLRELIRVAEITEIEGDNDQQNTQLFVTAPLVLAYLILDDLPPARYALTRLPEGLLALPLPQLLLKLLSSTWERNHAKVYSRAADLSHMLAQPNFPEKELVTVISTMLGAFLDSFRHRTFVLLSKAYVSIHLSLMQTYLGLPPEQLLPAVQKYNWSYDVSTQVLTPSTTSSISDNHGTTEIKAPSSLATFCLVASSVAKLEIQ